MGVGKAGISWRKDASHGVRVRIPATAGELVQGTLRGRDFLVTAPIDLYAEIEARIIPQRTTKIHPALPKTLAAAELAREALKITQGVEINIRNPIPVGKGMASSTADVAGVLTALAYLAGHSLSYDHLLRLALQIEPSDGTFLPGIAMLDHRGGSFYRLLGTPPPLDVVIVDLGGHVDTLSFNRRPDLPLLNQKKEKEVARAFRLVVAGIRTGNIALIAQGATLSAIAHQWVLYKQELPRLLSLTSGLGGLGICIAHSGTIVGLLFPPGEGKAKEDRISKLVNRSVATYRLVGGGAVVELLGS